VDFMPTSDGRIVLTHVWRNMPNRIPGAPDHIVSHAEFMSFRLFNRYTPMDLDMLIAFLDEHPDIRIITDTKDGYDAYTALYVIAEQFPDHVDRFIAQAYRFDHVPRIRAIGFEDVIVTLYMYPEEFLAQPEEIARLAHEHAVYAVTIPEYGIMPDYAERLDIAHIRFFAHTVNNPLRAEQLWEMGFYGIYTNFLIYEEGQAVPQTWGLSPNIEGELERLAENINQLEVEQLSLLLDLQLYRLDTPIYVDGRWTLPRALQVGLAPFPSLPFIDPGLVTPIAKYDTDVIYLPNPVSDFWSFMIWDEGYPLIVNPDTPEEFELTTGWLQYRNHFFFSIETIEAHADYQVLQLGAFLIVARADADLDEAELLMIAELLFA
ncbi:MAG: hypothetical protein FWD84_02880, partial [Oscillospiraceae bacterium]|nr:hypothetical protein [Oscillospiraceae bacterium]